MKLIAPFITAIVACFLLDMLWLGLIAKNIYQTELSSLLRKSGDAFMPNWSAAVIVYLAIALGIVCFVLPKAQSDIPMTAAWGALFGLVTYAIYDFTNLAILANWSLKIALVDVVWGTVLCGATSVITVLVQRWFNA